MTFGISIGNVYDLGPLLVELFYDVAARVYLSSDYFLCLWSAFNVAGL